MKLIEARVDWRKGFDNLPQLVLVVDRMPGLSTMRYEKANGIYYAENEDGYVFFLAYKSPGKGFCGRRFELTMKDGRKEVLEGPWSSRAGAAMLAGFGPCLDVVYYEVEGEYKNLGYSGHCTLSLAKLAISTTDYYLVKFDDNGEEIYVPSLHPEYLRKMRKWPNQPEVLTQYFNHKWIEVME